jgi:hypothetical protein
MTRDEKYWFWHCFLRSSSTGLIAIILFYIGIREKALGPPGRGWIVFIVIGGLMGMWIFFRFFSVRSMKHLVNKVYNGKMTYENLFSYEVSKQRLSKVALFTIISTILFILINFSVYLSPYPIITVILILSQAAGALLLSYQRSSNKLQLSRTAGAIEQLRFEKQFLHE